MATYIAEFKGAHKIIQIEQHSCFIWNQDVGEIDIEMLKNKIMRESTIHFYKLVAGTTVPIAFDQLKVTIVKTDAFNG